MSRVAKKNMQCIGCVYNTGKFTTGCEAFKTRPIDCTNHTTKEQSKIVESDIEKYSEYFNKKSVNPYLRYNDANI